MAGVASMIRPRNAEVQGIMLSNQPLNLTGGFMPNCVKFYAGSSIQRR